MRQSLSFAAFTDDNINPLETLAETSQVAKYAGTASRFLKVLAIVGIFADGFILAFDVSEATTRLIVLTQKWSFSSTSKGSRKMNSTRPSGNCMCLASSPRCMGACVTPSKPRHVSLSVVLAANAYLTSRMG